MRKTPFLTNKFNNSRVLLNISAFAAACLLTSAVSHYVQPFSIGIHTVQTILCSSFSLCSEKQPFLSDINPLIIYGKKAAVAAKKDFPQTEKSAPSTVQTKAEAAPVKAVISQATNSFQVSNDSGKSFDFQAISASPPAFLKENASVLIVHTHTSESYTPSEKYNYTPSDNDRTLDKNYNVVRIGKEIKDVLEEKGIKVYHDTTINDYPSYNGSYNRSASNISNFIANDPSIKIVLDVHRDAVSGSGGEKIKHICTVNDKTAACVMFVVGTNLSGLSHDNWQTNMSFALLAQQHINSMYPGLCRPINLRKQRFNQQLAPGAVIAEVGTNGNTLDEAINGAHYFAEGLADFIIKSK